MILMMTLMAISIIVCGLILYGKINLGSLRTSERRVVIAVMFGPTIVAIATTTFGLMEVEGKRMEAAIEKVEKIAKPGLALSALSEFVAVVRMAAESRVHHDHQQPTSRDGELDCAGGDLSSCGSCLSDVDCEGGQACVTGKNRRKECVSSTCSSDSDCDANQQCVRIDGGYDAVFGCVTVGPLERGEPCFRLGEVGCARGLECMAGMCRSTCDKGCSGSESCGLVNDRQFCVLSSCDGISCPDGSSCVRGMCLRGVDCSQPDACEDGSVCITTGAGLNWAGACFTACSPWNPCGRGSICGHAGVCVEPCDPKNPECPPDHKCKSSSESPDSWGCYLTVKT